jgi:hypothetical protein
MSHRGEGSLTEGVIRSVDPLNRELVLGVGPGSKGPVADESVEDSRESVTFHVPLDCLILLNQERVRMRMLQPLDRAAVSFTCGSGQLGSEHLVAHSICIGPQDFAAHSS